MAFEGVGLGAGPVVGDKPGDPPDPVGREPDSGPGPERDRVDGGVEVASGARELGSIGSIPFGPEQTTAGIATTLWS